MAGARRGPFERGVFPVPLPVSLAAHDLVSNSVVPARFQH